MRSPILNDRGQFRFTDFVAYLPDFLKTEPDVVTLMQVFSDYINNAYRNIDTVEKFEFKLIAREDRIDAVMARLNALRGMFELAANRNDTAAFLSVPRANVKSNITFGKSTAKSAYVVNYAGSEVVGQISGATGIDEGLSKFDDGDVIYVNYVALNDGEEMHPYYYDKGTNSLIADSMGTSQDPFTGTANQPARIVTFKVSDVSSVKKRFGNVVGSNKYYEIFFTARIYDVANDRSVIPVSYDVDLHDGADESVIVDYYDTEYVSKDKYHTYIRFFGKNGWAWKDGYPTGMFYFRDTTNAKLTTVQSDDRRVAPMEVCGDPIALKSATRYGVHSYKVNNDNSITVQLESYYPMYDSTSVYLVNAKTGEIIGEYTLKSESEVSSELTSTLIPNGRVDVQSIMQAESLALIEIPLFYNRGILDYDTAKAIIKWDSHIALDNGSTPIYNGKTKAASYEESGVSNIGKVTLTRAEITGGRLVEFPKEIAAKLGKAPSGKRIYCDNVYWDGCIVINSWKKDTLTGAIYEMIPGTYVHTNASIESANLYVVESAFAKVLNGKVSFDYIDTSVVETGKYAYLTGAVNAFTRITDNGFSVSLPDGEYLVHVLNKADARITGFDNVDVNGSDLRVGTCRFYRGNIFGAKYFVVTDSNGNTELLHCVTDVPEKTAGQYGKGDYAYDPSNGMIYSCTKQTVLNEGELPSASNSFKIDRIAHYVVKYGDRASLNPFMPYYGQFSMIEYGEGVDYGKDISLVTEPLYIEKVEEHALKYGWEHREFLNYGDYINMGRRDRNGFAEFFSTARYAEPESMESKRDIVDSSLGDRAVWAFPYPVIKNGANAINIIDIDNPVSVSVKRVIASEIGKEDEWEVFIDSAAHGLVDGCRIVVSGIGAVSVKTTNGNGLLNINTVDIDAEVENIANGFATVHVIDGDHFSYRVSGAKSITSTGVVLASITDSAKIVYSGEFAYRIVSIEGTDDGHYNLLLECPGYGLKNGMNISLADCGSSDAVDAVVDDDDTEGNRVVTVSVKSGIEISAGKYARLILPIDAEGKYVLTDVKFDSDSGNPATYNIYEVADGDWIKRDPYDIPSQSTLYCKANLFDCTVTNYPYALGDAIRISKIEYVENDRALVKLRAPILSFTEENAGIVEGRSRVFIRNVYPSDYCGWHLVTKIHDPYTFEIAIKLRNISQTSGIPVKDSEMTCYEGRWYKYTMNDIEWARRSNCVTYSVKNVLDSYDSGRYLTSYKHDFKVGDYAVIAPSEQFYDFDRTYTDSEWTQVKITKVISEKGIEFAPVYSVIGDKRVPASSTAEYIGKSIVKGIVLPTADDNLTALAKTYSLRISALNNEMYRFEPGTIVVAMGQVNSDEISAYMVEGNIDWAPLRRKRVMKIDDISIDKYLNPEFGEKTVEDGVDEFKYTTYSDVDVYNDSESYICPMQHTRNGHFNKPSLEGMDTTRNPNVEYSSAEDYSTVSPRYDMKKSFKGIPDMKYPLVEKIERFSYLHDPDVIDYDFIGYLARFMGYDITPAAEDVETSNLYRTIKEQEKAIRETVANLPQYYSLGGTEAGLKMLMSTFGIISDVLTLYTNTTDPYTELLSKDEVDERLMKEARNGKVVGTWVPTPYINIEITDDVRFPQFSLQQGDIPRIKEQIRVWKPINVVFKDFILRYTGEIGIKASINGVITSGEMSGGVITTDYTGSEPKSVADAFVDYVDESLTNCAF